MTLPCASQSCQQKTKKNRKAETLISSPEFRVGEILLEAANALKDEVARRILLNFHDGRPDCIVADTMYHFSCCRNHIHPATDAALLAKDSSNKDTKLNPYDKAFKWQAGCIEMELVGGNDVRAMWMDKVHDRHAH